MKKGDDDDDDDDDDHHHHHDHSHTHNPGFSVADHKGGCTTRALPRVKLQGSSAWYLEKCVGLAWSGALGDSKTNWQLAPDDQAILK